MIACPNCGYNQPEGAKCVKCSSLFSYYAAAAALPTSSVMASPASFAAEDSAQAPTFRERFALAFKIYRVFRWASLIAAALTLLMILHKSPPPIMPAPDPSAAARAQQKFTEAQQAVAQGEAYQLTLDGPELNSYLNSNLQMAGVTPANESSASQPLDAGRASGTAFSAPNATADAPPSLAEAQSSVRDVKVDLVGDLVKAYVVFNFHGKDLSLELDGHLSSVNGYLQFQPTSGFLGSLPLLQSALDAAVQKMMSSPENREKLHLPVGISGIHVAGGELVVDYR